MPKEKLNSDCTIKDNTASSVYIRQSRIRGGYASWSGFLPNGSVKKETSFIKNKKKEIQFNSTRLKNDLVISDLIAALL